MKKCHTTVARHPLNGLLDARTPLGNAPVNDFRVLVNTEMVEQNKFSRRPGWQGLMRDQPLPLAFSKNSRGNRDLHDQLLDLTSNPLNAQREAINFHIQVKSDCNAYSFVAATRSRIYASTGTSANWRIIADGLGPIGEDKFAPYGSVRWMGVQLGNYILFTNDYNYVLGWKIGDPPDPERELTGDEIEALPEGEDPPDCSTAQSAKPILEILGLDILRAGCICEWSGFVFLGDVETVKGRECDTIYWCDFNNPLSWMPSEESAAGFVSLSRGEKVLRMEPLAGQLRVYTNLAIYNVTLVGEAEVFRFTEIYRGPDALAYRFGFANLGDSHIYLSNEGLVELRLYDAMPNRVELIHKASGVITRGLDGRLMRDYPGPFKGFTGLRKDLCNQLVGGYDKCRREIWFSWPTGDEDNSDSEHIRRMSLVISRLYRHATLVDHGFSSFCNFVPKDILSFRDWLITIGACSDHALGPRMCKEGPPYNAPDPAVPPPLYVINEGEVNFCSQADNPENDVGCPSGPPLPPGATRACVDETIPCNPGPDSVCESTWGSQDVLQLCAPCEADCKFSMASLRDFCLKEQDDTLRVREVFVGPGAITGDVYYGMWAEPLPAEWKQNYFVSPTTGNWDDLNKVFKTERDDTYEFPTPPSGHHWYAVLWFPLNLLKGAAPWLTAKVQGFDFLFNPGPGESFVDLKINGVPGKLFLSYYPSDGGFNTANGNPMLIS